MAATQQRHEDQERDPHDPLGTTGHPPRPRILCSDQVIGPQSSTPARRPPREHVPGLGRHQGEDRGATVPTRSRRAARLPPAQNQRASSGSPASSSTVVITSPRRSAVASRRRAGQAPQAASCRRHREQQPAANPARHQRLPGDQPYSARQASRGHPAAPRRLGPDRLGPVPPPGRHQPRRAAPAAAAARPSPIMRPRPRTAPRLLRRHRLRLPGPRPPGARAARSAGAGRAPAALASAPQRWPARRPSAGTGAAAAGPARLVLPARLDQAPVGQPDQDRVQRARLQPGLPGQRVPVLPLRRLAHSAAAPTASAPRTRNARLTPETLHR